MSERNCIEVVSLLIEKGFIDVIFTNDGKEYLTHAHLEKEINDELYVAGGRINLVELSKILNVDLQKVGKAAEEVVKQNDSVRLILGQLIDESYIQRTASEINEKLAQSGELNVADLTVIYDLPSEFLLEQVMEKYLGILVHGKQDSSNPRIFFTNSYVQRCKAKIRGALAGITAPINVATILAQSGVKERIFFTLIKDVNTSGTLTSRSIEAQYIPHIYTKMQVEYVKSFWKQNGYLELSLPGLGISDPKSFIQTHLAGEKIKQLSTCICSQRIIDQVASSLEECIATNSYLDISTLVPSAFDESDFKQILDIILTPNIRKQVLLFGTSTVMTLKYLDELIKPCYEVVTEKAKGVVDSGAYQQYIIEKQLANKPAEKEDTEPSRVDKRDERRKKAAGGSAGGGAQGRETKTKAVKKHTRGRKNESDSEGEEENFNASASKKKQKEPTLELFTTNDIKKVIKKPLEEEGLEDLTSEITAHYYPMLSKTALTLAQELYEASIANKNQGRRTTHTALQDKLNTLINDIRLYEKGLKLLPTDQQSALVKYLLKSLGTDICNEFASYIANECNLALPNVPQLTAEHRTKIVNECQKEYKLALQTLNKALSGTSVDEFVIAAENCLQACSMVLKKVDKKKDRTVVLCHKHQLLEQLANTTEPAMVLHLAILVIFTVATQNILHASGRHISGILTSFLKSHMNQEQYAAFQKYHDLVLMQLSGQNTESSKKSANKNSAAISENFFNK